MSRRGSVEMKKEESSSDEGDIVSPVVVDEIYSDYEGLTGITPSSGTQQSGNSFSHSQFSGMSGTSFSRSPAMNSPSRGLMTSSLK